MKHNLLITYFILAILASSLLSTPTIAATYYVSSTIGSDSNLGISQSAPWKTISKVNKSSFQPGDNILFKRGEIWREQLTVPSSGTSGHPIMFGTYGTGDNPVISGADVVSTWSDVGSSIYSATLTTEPHQIFYNDTRLTENDGGKTSVGENEWDWDSNTLYINVGEDPADGTVETSQRNEAARVVRNYITINGLTFKQGNNESTGTLFLDGDNITVKNCDVSWGAHMGIVFVGTGVDLLVDSCKLHDNGAGGKYDSSGFFSYKDAGGTGHEKIISNNWSYNNYGFGIYIWGNYYIVEKNRVYDNGNNTGMAIGIEFFNGDNDGYGQHNIARYNYVSGQKTGDDDGQGITADDFSSYIDIYGNVVTGCDGAAFCAWRSNHVNIYNNTAYGNVKNTGASINKKAEIRVGASGGGESSYISIKNNIGQATEANTYAIYIDANAYGGTGLDITNNDWHSAATNWYYWNTVSGDSLSTWNSSPGIGTDLNSDPLFTNAEKADFTLQSGSLCINAGTNLGALKYALAPDSSWPNSVTTLDQNHYGTGWEIGAYVKSTLSPPSILRIIHTTVH